MLGLPARRVGPSALELFDGTADDFSGASFSVRINARTTVQFSSEEAVAHRFGNGILDPDLVGVLARRAKLRVADGGYTGHFHLPVFYVPARFGKTDYVLVLSYGEGDPGAYLLQLEGIWKVRPKAGPDPIHLTYDTETPRPRWWLRLLPRRERRGGSLLR